jgi:hypothetical protein
VCSVLYQKGMYIQIDITPVLRPCNYFGIFIYLLEAPKLPVEPVDFKTMCWRGIRSQSSAEARYVRPFVRNANREHERRPIIWFPKRLNLCVWRHSDVIGHHPKPQ